jgi:hypothetical protein
MNLAVEAFYDDLEKLEAEFSFWWHRRPESLDTLDRVMEMAETLLEKAQNTHDLCGGHRTKILRPAFMIHEFCKGFGCSCSELPT